MAQPETHRFETEAAQVLELMTHSVYSNRDTFLRELISNASDAIDRRKFAGLSDQSLLASDGDYHIFLKVDSEARTLSVIDNGIGMTRDEVIADIGTIARSGTKEFLKALANVNKDAIATPDLIGQFGVGFYATFMVSQRVVLDTLKAGDTEATRWESTGDGTYTIEAGERREPGTTVTLFLKDADEEDGVRDYTESWTLREIVKRYSDFVAYPVKTNVTRQTPECDAEGKVIEGGKTETVVETETLNSMRAIWTRPASEVKDEEYEEFYRHVSHDWHPPLRRVIVNAEGAHEYRGVLFIPKKAPFDLFHLGGEHGLKLYVRRILIVDECKDLLPGYLRFVRGVVDAEDLSLNISREMLQEDRQIKVIRKHLTKKVLEALRSLKDEEAEAYEGWWHEMGVTIKEGTYQDPAQKNALLDLIMCHSTHESGKLTTLRAYVERMKEGQEDIYYMTGPSLPAVKGSPHLESFRDKGYEVLLFVDPVDEIWLQQGAAFDKHKLVSIGKGSVELGSEEERKEAEKALEDKRSTYKSLLTRLRSELQDDIKEVRLSTRMTESPACLVGDANDMSPQLQQMLKAAGQEPPKQQRILELNPNHPVLERLQRAFDADPKTDTLTRYAKLLYGQALLAEGGQLEEPAEFTRLMNDVMVRALDRL